MAWKGGLGVPPKLNRAQMAEIKERYARGENQGVLAAEFDVTRSSISHVVTGKYTALEDRQEEAERLSFAKDWVFIGAKIPQAHRAALEAMTTPRGKTLTDVMREAIAFYIDHHNEVSHD